MDRGNNYTDLSKYNEALQVSVPLKSFSSTFACIFELDLLSYFDILGWSLILYNGLQLYVKNYFLKTFLQILIRNTSLRM